MNRRGYDSTGPLPEAFELDKSSGSVAKPSGRGVGKFLARSRGKRLRKSSNTGDGIFDTLNDRFGVCSGGIASRL